MKDLFQLKFPVFMIFYNAILSAMFVLTAYFSILHKYRLKATEGS